MSRILLMSLALATASFVFAAGSPVVQAQMGDCSGQPHYGCYICNPQAPGVWCTWVPAHCDEEPEYEECEGACEDADCYCGFHPHEQGCVCDDSGCHYDTCEDHPEDPACNGPCPTCDPGCRENCGDICTMDGVCFMCDKTGGCTPDATVKDALPRASVPDAALERALQALLP